MASRRAYVELIYCHASARPFVLLSILIFVIISESSRGIIIPARVVIEATSPLSDSPTGAVASWAIQTVPGTSKEEGQRSSTWRGGSTVKEPVLTSQFQGAYCWHFCHILLPAPCR